MAKGETKCISYKCKAKLRPWFGSPGYNQGFRFQRPTVTFNIILGSRLSRRSAVGGRLSLRSAVSAVSVGGRRSPSAVGGRLSACRVGGRRPALGSRGLGGLTAVSAD